MKRTALKRWAGLGLSTAFLGTGLVGCDSPEESAARAAAEASSEPGATAHGEGEGEAGEGEGGEGEAGEASHDMGRLPLPKRLAFMSGHVEAGLALYRAGEPGMAAPHLLHPVSETHESERAGLDELGFQPELFETVSAALEAGRPAAELGPQLQAAEQNLAAVAERAGGDPAEIIRYLMEVIVDEYSVAIDEEGAVSDPGEYQDAYGFAIVARDRAEGMQPVLDEIDALLALWPDQAPIPPDSPTPVAVIVAQTSKVLLALP